MNLGNILKKHRKSNRLTLKIVADRAGISEGFLSQIENNVNSPSVETLMNICGAIGVNAGDILTQVESQEKLSLIKKSEWEDIEIPPSGFATRRFFPPENRSEIDSAIIIFEPGKNIPGRKNVKNSQEILCVLKGSIQFLYGEKVLNLTEGDSFHYWTYPEKQMISNNSSSNAVVLWIGTI